MRRRNLLAPAQRERLDKWTGSADTLVRHHVLSLQDTRHVIPVIACTHGLVTADSPIFFSRTFHPHDQRSAVGPD